MGRGAKRYFSPDEYLLLEENRQIESEFYDGAIFVFAGASINHYRIVSSLGSSLNFAFKNKNGS
ncbi:MAG: hypothetical protein GWN13_05470 [Phycisphaerae bacterium]|nr:hypothetical protein [Phycisphaerae bacterium]